jgi:hypothetical protein
MSDRDDFDRAISLLRDGPIAMSDPDATRTCRERALPAMRALVVGTPRRLRRRRRIRSAIFATGVVSCAAMAWLAFGLERPQPLPAMLDTVLVEMPRSNQATWSDGNAAPQLLGTRSRVPLRGSLRSLGEKAVTLRTPQGAQVALAEKSEVDLGQVALAPNRSVLGLNAGHIRCTVPRLPAGSVFSVRTSDAEVIVHGTVFSVEAPGNTASTCVRVEEGRVEVRRGAQVRMLEAGGSFGCTTLSPTPLSMVSANDASAAETTGKSSTTTAGARRASAVSHEPRTATTAANESSSGTLAEESRLLAAALVKEREGSRAQAYELFLSLTTRFPQSALAIEARAGLTRTRALESR